MKIPAGKVLFGIILFLAAGIACLFFPWLRFAGVFLIWSAAFIIAISATNVLDGGLKEQPKPEKELLEKYNGLRKASRKDYVLSLLTLFGIVPFILLPAISKSYIWISIPAIIAIGLVSRHFRIRGSMEGWDSVGEYMRVATKDMPESDKQKVDRSMKNLGVIIVVYIVGLALITEFLTPFINSHF